MRGETATPRPVLYVRVTAQTKEELEELARAGERGSTLSAVTSRVLEDGLRYDETAVLSLLSWCWRIAGYMTRDHEELAGEFTKAIVRCELALRIRSQE